MSGVLSDVMSTTWNTTSNETSIIALDAALATASDQALFPETSLLIRCMAKSISGCMLAQLGQASDASHQYTRNPMIMRGRTTGDIFDQVLYEMLSRSLTHRMGLHRTIIVDIDEVANAEKENSLVNAFKRNNFSLVPVRLIQLLDRPVTREASKLFGEELMEAVQAYFTQGLNAVGEHRVRQLFTREQMMHRAEHSMEDSEACCIFRLYEEDYEMPFDKSKLDNNNFNFKKEGLVYSKAFTDSVFKHKLVEFSINCGVCGGRHEFKVVR